MSRKRAVLLLALLFGAGLLGCALPARSTGEDPAGETDALRAGGGTNPSPAPPGERPAQKKEERAATGRDSYGPDFIREPPKGDRVLARVGGEEIRASDCFQVFFLDNPMKTRGVLESLVLFKLVCSEAERLGIAVDAGETEEVLERMLEEQQGRIAMGIDEKMTLADFVREQYAMEMQDYRTLIRRTAVFQLLLERCVRYAELRVRRLRIGVILMEDQAMAEEVHKKLVKGASFDLLAKENSIDPSRTRGGILPPLPEDLDYPIVKEGMKLSLGEISAVEETELSGKKVYRIIRLVDIMEPLQGSYKELEKRVEASLMDHPLIPDVIPYWEDSVKERYGLELRLNQ